MSLSSFSMIPSLRFLYLHCPLPKPCEYTLQAYSILQYIGSVSAELLSSSQVSVFRQAAYCSAAMSVIHPSGFKTENLVSYLIQSTGHNLNGPANFKLHQALLPAPLRNDLIVPITCLGYVVVLSRLNFENIGNESVIFTAAFAALIINSVIFFPVLASRLVLIHTASDKVDSYYYRKSLSFQQVAVRLHLQDAVCIFSVFVNGLNLLGRVYAGQCSSNISIWGSQTCNPFADAGTIPADQTILVYLTPLILQLIIRGVSKTALVTAWLLSLTFVTIASAHIGGYLQVWTLTCSIFFLLVMLMAEELMRTTFLQGQAMIAASAESFKQELALMELSTTVGKELKEKEVYQLKSLMGNVAHDLKTPLHSIEADLEMMRMFISNLPQSALRVEDLRVNRIIDNLDVQSILNSLTATCKFMGMSINRSQDFMKSSNNIALVPLMETLELKSALCMSVTCLNNLESGKSITVHPIPGEICPQVISDKHWISENVLCLLSNAVKYSDDGSIDVRMKLIDVPIEDAIPSPSLAPLGEKFDIQNEERSSSATSRLSTSFESVYITMQPMLNISTGYADQTERAPHSFPDIQAPGMAMVLDTGTKVTAMGSGTGVGAEDTGLGMGSKSWSKQMLMITVEDNGIGIPEEKHSQLFQPFQQAQRMAGGTGLGLYSLAKRMEALGGECGVSNRSDGAQGSMFWFSFPYRPDETRIDNIPEDSLVNPTPNVTMKPKNILIIDDSLTILKATGRLLKMNGHTVTTAANGSIGLKLLKQSYLTQEFDMVLTDIQMPVMDGIEATRRYREFESAEMELEKKKNNTRNKQDSDGNSECFSDVLSSCQDDSNKTDWNKIETKRIYITDNNVNDLDVMERNKLIIVGMSANSDSLTQQEALGCGMDYFLSKPFNYKHLLAIFKQVHLNC